MSTVDREDIPMPMSASAAKIPAADRMTAQPDQYAKAKVIGLYGVPGVGKTILLQNLEAYLHMEGRERYFMFFEGSQVIEELVDGGLDSFKAMDEDTKTQWRGKAIAHIAKQCAQSGKTGIVTGHLMFWSRENQSLKTVFTNADASAYTHILYLDRDAAVVAQQRSNDKTRKREPISVPSILEWQLLEKKNLRRICYENNILLSSVSMSLHSKNETARIARLVQDFHSHSESANEGGAKRMLDEVIAANCSRIETMLVLDADRTLAPEDTGEMFWTEILRKSKGQLPESYLSPLKSLFKSKMQYSYNAFRQAALLYEHTADRGIFDATCEQVASKVELYPEMINLMRLVAEQEHVGMVVITSGLRLVWQKVLEKEGFSDAVGVVGGGRIREGYVVPAELKGTLVRHMRNHHGLYVWAFGDSPLDLPMLKEADRAFVVVGEEGTRSSSMDKALKDAIENGLDAQQVLLPSTVSWRLTREELPPIRIWENEFVQSLIQRRLHFFHATHKEASKLLATPTRDASMAGPALRDAHRRVGNYLATEYLADILGLEKYGMEHVQGMTTGGYRLHKEKETLVVALMRGGEPMAFGVSETFPNASFLHAKEPEDITPHYLEGQSAVVLVDSVVNNGTTVEEFEGHIRSLSPDLQVVVVAGVIQEQCIRTNGIIRKLLKNPNFSVVALRLSENKFTGKGATDTGHRLFNTTKIRQESSKSFL